METSAILERETIAFNVDPGIAFKPRKVPGKWIGFFVRRRAKLRIAWLALKAYRSVKKARVALGHFMAFKKLIVGGNGKRKLVTKNGKYGLGLYVPPFPSDNFDRFVLTELNRYIPHQLPVNAHQQVNFAITTHCPMRCEHCFEWDNLNHPETFSLDELKEITGTLQSEGLGHISLSGGEPMVRFRDILELIRNGAKTTEWWILTSGFNLTHEKALQLKAAGATGVVISIDHHDAGLHNLFRGHAEAYFHATRAAAASSAAGLFTAVSVCITRGNANRDFVIKHMEMCYRLGADYVQWLEPRAEGQYRGKDVMLGEKNIALLENMYETLNHDPVFAYLPTVVYHGYHQRRIGCQSGGKFSFYVDAAGMVHSCPFCHSHDFKVRDWLNEPVEERALITACSAF
jgi:MoaA/NifB/PqqE/SkfB family radical SAM enzyme